MFQPGRHVAKYRPVWLTSFAAISYASSYAVYGDQPQAAADQPLAPPMFYGAFEQAVDLIAEQYWRHCGLRSIAIRPPVVYGPERELGLPGRRARYVEDVARAFVRGALDCRAGATIVDLPSEPATTEAFAGLLADLLPSAAGDSVERSTHAATDIADAGLLPKAERHSAALPAYELSEPFE